MRDGKWNITDMWCFDLELCDDILLLLNYISRQSFVYPSDILPRDEIVFILNKWRPARKAFVRK